MAQRKTDEVAKLPETIKCPNGIVITLPNILKASQSTPALGEQKGQQLAPLTSQQEMPPALASRKEALKAFADVTRHQENVISRRVAQKAEARMQRQKKQRDTDAVVRSAKEDGFLEDLQKRRKTKQRYCPRLLFLDFDDLETFMRPQTKGGERDALPSPAPSPKLASRWPSKRIEFRDETLVIGRAHDCDVVVDSLTHPSMVSKVHLLLLARFDIETSMPVDLWALDLNSRNGTFLNGSRLKRSTAGSDNQSAASVKRMREEVRP
jgi:hypothetical protein